MNTTDSPTSGTPGHEQISSAVEKVTRWEHYVVGAGATLGVIATILSVATYLNVDRLVADALERASLDQLKSRAQDAVEEAKEMAENAKEILEEIENLRSASAIEVLDLRQRWQAELRTLGNWNSVGVVDSMYLMHVPEGEGTTLWETNVSTREFSVASIGTWEMFTTDRDVQCNYVETVDLSMDRSPSTWRIRVTKPRGCDTVRAGVTFFPAAWVEQVHDEEILERVN